MLVLISVTNTSNDSQVITTRNLQEILSKLSVEETPKTHEFWDTQPVPKLGKSHHPPGNLYVVCTYLR